MSTTAALLVVVAVMVAVNLWVHLGPRWSQLLTGPAAAVLLLLVGRAAGLTWAEMGLGRAALPRGAWVGALAVGLVAVGYAVALAVPRTHRFFRDTRYRLGPGAAVRTAVVTVPLSTVVVEEVAFRGVLWGLLAVEYGPLWATVGSALLFGIWHVLPALVVARTNQSLTRDSRSARVRTVVGTVVFTALAGVVFGELRRLTGSLVAPAALHWATNGLGVLASARVWALDPAGAVSSRPPGSSGPPGPAP